MPLAAEDERCRVAQLVDARRPMVGPRSRAPAASDRPEEVTVCEVCGLVSRLPAPPVCPACGAGHG